FDFNYLFIVICQILWSLIFFATSPINHMDLSNYNSAGEKSSKIGATNELISFGSQRILSFQKIGVASCFANRATLDLFSRKQTIYELREHLSAAINWLKRAHDNTVDGGVSWGYSLKGDWRKSYPETSGYIAITLFDVALQLDDDDSWKRAVNIAKWLIQIQNDDGSISNSRYSSSGIVFDTGQVLLGLIRAFIETQEQYFLEAALCAGNWLVAVASCELVWTNYTHLGIPHVYNTRVAWGLLQLNILSPRKDYLSVALANLEWGLANQKCGWFENCAFSVDDAPFTHNIAYALRGLLESGILLEEQRYIDAAIRGSQVVRSHLHTNGFIPGQISSDGSAQSSYCCLTGNCQMSIVWLKLFEITNDISYYQAAKRSMEYVMSSQDIDTSNLNIRGGIKGSQPIWGKYTRLSYPNWATKFFIDGLLMLIRAKL
ncbi:MAG: hypothetical protein AAF349_27025, partial [Cyanobacteria bacterium P01_A01_bin.68]